MKLRKREIKEGNLNSKNKRKGKMKQRNYTYQGDGKA